MEQYQDKIYNIKKGIIGFKDKQFINRSAYIILFSVHVHVYGKKKRKKNT